MQPLNINDWVLVNLTPAGRAALKELYGNMRIPYRAPTEDSEGRSRWQLADLIMVFGPRMCAGCELPFETTILVPDDAADVPTMVQKPPTPEGARK